jgi:hypothetical protein
MKRNLGSRKATRCLIAIRSSRGSCTCDPSLYPPLLERSPGGLCAACSLAGHSAQSISVPPFRIERKNELGTSSRKIWLLFIICSQQRRHMFSFINISAHIFPFLSNYIRHIYFHIQMRQQLYLSMPLATTWAQISSELFRY